MEPTNEQRPNAALINREWFLAARDILTREELANLTLIAVEYVILNREPVKVSKSVDLVFRMIRPALDSDIDRYRERCARNAANARAGRERVAASGTQSQPVAANTTPTTTTTTKTTTTPTTSLSAAEMEEREKWLVFGYFWSVGDSNPKGELDAFWNYYDALGWKNNKGAPIVRKLSCAAQWGRQFETKPVPDGAPVWFSVMKDCDIADYSLFSGYMGAERVESNVIVRLRVSDAWLDAFKKHCADLIKQLCKVWRCDVVHVERVP